MRNILRATLAAAILLASYTLYADGLPVDPFQRTATKALRGDFGKLQAWQEAGYKRGLEQGVTASTSIWLTAYYGTEGRMGQVDSRGNRCTYRTCASNKVKRGSYIWTKYGLRQVLDCGAKFNDGIARRKGASLWVDYWYPSARHATFGDNAGVTMAAVIR